MCTQYLTRNTFFQLLEMNVSQALMLLSILLPLLAASQEDVQSSTNATATESARNGKSTFFSYFALEVAASLCPEMARE